MATVNRWINTSNHTLQLTFDVDEKHDNLSLNELLAFDLKLEPYENGRPPAKPKGAEAKRAAQNAPGAPDTSHGHHARWI